MADNIVSPADESKSSLTALSVAMGFSRALVTKYAYLFSQAQLELQTHLWQTGRQSLGLFNWVASGIISLAPYTLQQAFFNSYVPGYDQSIMLRKLMIKNKIEESIAAGATQIVLLGGGYDIRALITALQNPNVRVFELDRGVTREYKLKGLKSIPKGIGFDDLKIRQGINGETIIGDNLFYISCDLVKEKLSTVLGKHGFDPQKKSLFIAEGLTMYLNKSENEALLKTISDLMTDDSELLLSYMNCLRDVGQLEKKAIDEAKEIYQFPLPPKDVLPFAESFGYDVCKKFDGTTHFQNIGDSAADYYQKNPNLHKEWYYLLKKSAGGLHKKLEEVPDIQLNVPTLFPKSYTKVTSNQKSSLAKAIELLEDYTKHNSGVSLFFHGHWNRHHRAEVNQIILRCSSKGTDAITSIDSLRSALQSIKLVNKSGSLSRRIKFIDELDKSSIQPPEQLQQTRMNLK